MNRTSTLGAEAEIIMGQSPPGDTYNTAGNGTPLLNGPTEFGPIHPTARQWTTSPTKMCRAGDILFCVRGATAGRVNEADRPYCLGRGLAAVRAKEGQFDNAFLRYVLKAGYVEFQTRGVGSTFINISSETLSVFPIPLFPVDQQSRIAAILDQADALRAKRRAALAQLDEMAQALFVEMFGDLSSNLSGWDGTRMLGDVADVSSGITKGRKPPVSALRSVPYLAVANVQDRALKLDAVKRIEASEDEITRYKLQENDLVLTEGGDPDKLGRGVLWHRELPECIHQNHIFRVRITSPVVHPLFLNWLVGSDYGKRYFLRSAKQTTGIASINASQLRAFPLKLPPMPLQAQFTARLEQLRYLKRGAEQSMAGIDILFASLQHRAFTGAL